MIVSKITPSYLYQEYADDQDLQAFVRAQNDLAQSYLDWFTATPLAIYTLPAIANDLLDWVGEGLYGYPRPVLPYGFLKTTGPYNTWAYNQFAYNTRSLPTFSAGAIGTTFTIGKSAIGGGYSGGREAFATSDDAYKRCLTWNLYKGDGRLFNVRWLKRRIARFLNGADGVDPGVNETYDISVVFGKGTLVNIILVGGVLKTSNSTVYNRLTYNKNAVYNAGVPTYTGSRGKLLKVAIESGALQLPFQYRYQVYG